MSDTLTQYSSTAGDGSGAGFYAAVLPDEGRQVQFLILNIYVF